MSVNDYFRGAELSTFSADRFAKDHIKDKMLQMDVPLFESKWWDYRVMHPTHATHYFYHLYGDMVADYIGKNFSTQDGIRYRRAHNKKALKDLPLGAVRGIWKARMAADMLGVPYEVYIRCALDDFYANYRTFATTKALHHKAPLPQVHLASRSILTKVMLRWPELQAAELYIPESEAVLNQPVWFRAEMEKALIEQAGKTQYVEFFIQKARRVGAITSPD